MTDEIEDVDLVGEGAFGVVRRVVYEGQDAVVKVPRLGDYHAPHFRHEAQVLQYLAGTAGAPLLLHLGPPEDPTITMTNTGSTTLQDLLDDEVLDERGVVETTLSVAMRLKEVHAKGVVHNDLKADNVMVSATSSCHGEREVSLIDFGISRFMEDVEPQKFELHERYGAEVMCEKGDPANDVLGLGDMLTEALDDVCFLGGEESLRGYLGTLMEAMTRECASERPDLDQVILSLQVLLEQ